MDPDRQPTSRPLCSQTLFFRPSNQSGKAWRFSRPPYTSELLAHLEGVSFHSGSQLVFAAWFLVKPVYSSIWVANRWNRGSWRKSFCVWHPKPVSCLQECGRFRTTHHEEPRWLQWQQQNFLHFFSKCRFDRSKNRESSVWVAIWIVVSGDPTIWLRPANFLPLCCLWTWTWQLRLPA